MRRSSYWCGCSNRKVKAASYWIVILLAGWTSPVNADSDVDFAINLCYSDGAPKRSEWDTNILLALGRVFDTQTGNVNVGIVRRSCAESALYGSCFAGPRGMQCRNESLERIHRAAAWYAAMINRANHHNYEQFRLSDPKAVQQAFRFTDGEPVSDDVQETIKALKEQEADPTAEPSSLLRLYESIVDLNYGALIGHEITHMTDDQCTLSSLSSIEGTGLWASTLEESLTGTLFCKQNPVKEELLADRCALRTLELVARKNAVNNFARRAAADMVAFQLLTGWRPPDEPGVFQMRPLEQYLHLPYRMILMTTAMQPGGKYPAVCGEAASLFVRGVEQTFLSCAGGGGEVSDELLALLPKGVEASWNGEPWTESSVSCHAKKDEVVLQ